MERITHAYRRRETDGPITVRGDASQVTPVAIGVLSWPVAFVKQRNDHFGLSHAPVRQRLRFANDHVRTISRIIVHPQFRSIGLASFLIRHLCAHCPTRYVEALAVMGRVHPMFERAGMTRFEPSRPDGPVYYLFDRTPESPADSDEVHVNT
jgi:ABC-type ATPase with predicted acetyltransferase domain